MAIDYRVLWTDSYSKKTLQKLVNLKEYSIIWKQFSQNSGLGEILEASEDFALPYFVDGADKKKFEEFSLDSLSEIHLLRGILVGYFDQPPILDTHIFKLKSKTILMDLQKHFAFDTMENLILNISAYIRNENGDDTSFQALLAGSEICPESSKIKFDCCTDLYNLLERDQYHDKKWGKEKLGELLHQIEVSEINTDFISHIDTYRQWLEQN